METQGKALGEQGKAVRRQWKGKERRRKDSERSRKTSARAIKGGEKTVGTQRKAAKRQWERKERRRKDSGRSRKGGEKTVRGQGKAVIMAVERVSETCGLPRIRRDLCWRRRRRTVSVRVEEKAVLVICLGGKPLSTMALPAWRPKERQYRGSKRQRKAVEGSEKAAEGQRHAVKRQWNGKERQWRSRLVRHNNLVACPAIQQSHCKDLGLCYGSDASATAKRSESAMQGEAARDCTSGCQIRELVQRPASGSAEHAVREQMIRAVCRAGNPSPVAGAVVPAVALNRLLLLVAL